MNGVEDIRKHFEDYKNENSKSFEEVKQEVLSDEEVKTILSKYGDAIDEKIINDGLGELFWLIRYRNEPEYRYFKLIINIQNGNLVHSYVERPEVLPLLNKPLHKRRLDLSMVSKENQLATFENYEQSPGRIKALSEVIEILKSYQEGKFFKGLWLVGGYGIGKSYLMAAMAKRLNRKLASVTMIDFSEFIANLKAQINLDGNNLERKLRAVEEVDILIIDDIGTETLTEWVANDILYRILNYRYKNEKPTFFTSNLTKQDYYQKLVTMKSKSDKTSVERSAQRILTRIDALAEEIQTSGDNRRTLYA